MTAEARILGEHPFATDAQGKLKSRIGTVFPQSRVLITLPGIHATQRQAWLDFLKEQRSRTAWAAHQGGGAVGMDPAVDLIFEADTILIPARSGGHSAGFSRGRLPAGDVSKHRIKFLGVLNQKVGGN